MSRAPLFSPETVRALLVAAAREGRAVSYSELLGALGHRFTRPKMRALCAVLGKVDEAGEAAGEPELAVLVVRESDRLPGQGWWAGRADMLGYEGDWTGPEARGFIRELQEEAIAYWGRAGIDTPPALAGGLGVVYLSWYRRERRATPSPSTKAWRGMARSVDELRR